MAEYRMKELEAILGKSAQSIHGVFREDEKLKELLPQHTILKGKRGKAYDDTILNALLEYYGDKKPAENEDAVANRVVGGTEETEPPQNTETHPGGDVNTSAANSEEIEVLRRQVEDLTQQLENEREGRKAERADLEKQLQDKEAERLHFIGENSKLLSILAAEKQEKDKLLLLMPPREHRTIRQRIRELFTHREGGKNE